MATMPPIFGHEGTGFGADPIMDIPADVGAMARTSFQVGSAIIGFNGYMTNGFQAEAHDEGGETGHDEGASAIRAVPEGGEGDEIPGIGIPASSGDVTNNKMVGGRLDIALPPWAELNISTFTGKYDEQDRLAMTGFDLAAELRRSGFEARGEYVRTRQDFEGDEGVHQLDRSGFYVQAAYRSGPWESVVRFTRIFNDRIGDETDINGASQFALGLDYWIGPSVAVMTSYEFNRETGLTIDNDRLNIHLAFGF